MLSNEQYLEAISHKFDLQDYPILILDTNLDYSFANEEYLRLYDSQTCEELDAYRDDGTTNLLNVSHSLKEFTRNIFLHKKPLYFVDTVICGGEKHMFLTKKMALIAPSGDCIGLECHMINLGSLLGVLSSWSFIGPFVRDDLPFSSHIRPFEITEIQESYIFFILKGCTNKEMSEAFGVSIRTVENNYRGLLKKLRQHSDREVLSRTDFRREAFRLGYGNSMPRALLRPSSIPIDGFDIDWNFCGKTKAFL